MCFRGPQLPGSTQAFLRSSTRRPKRRAAAEAESEAQHHKTATGCIGPLCRELRHLLSPVHAAQGNGKGERNVDCSCPNFYLFKEDMLVYKYSSAFKYCGFTKCMSHLLVPVCRVPSIPTGVHRVAEKEHVPMLVSSARKSDPFEGSRTRVSNPHATLCT